MADYPDLCRRLHALESVLVAYSGGVDSTLVLRAALDSLGPERVLAVTVVSPLRPADEGPHCQQLAARLGARHQVIPANELTIPAVAANRADRCYHCKHHIFSLCLQMARTQGLAQVVDGTHAGDSRGYRPGRRALQELGIVSPLCDGGLDKAAIRELARQLGLPVWDRPAAPCLATRFPYDTPLTAAALQRVGRCEQWLRTQGFTSLRVRDHGTLARIEIPPAQWPQLLDPSLRQALLLFFRAEGYQQISLDLEGLVSGGLDRFLPQEASP